MKMLTILISILFFQSANAFVDMKNSNFADSWIDYKTTGTGYQLKVQRTYNSRSTYDGLFGFGWCSDFETKLSLMPDNSLKITECGGGLEINYISGKTLKGSALNDHIEKLISMSQKVNPRLKKNYIKRLRKDLKENPYLRETLAKKLGVKGQISSGSKFYARGRGGESLSFSGNSYKRTLSDGTFQKFNKSGQLVAMYDRNSNYLKFLYNESKLQQVVDNNGKRIEFLYHSNGKVREVKAPGGFKARYTYDGQDLVHVSNAWKMQYSYSYDRLHNLTKITFPDKTTKELTYNQDKDLVLSFKDRNNCKETYTYQGSKKDPRNHYWSLIEKKCNGKITNKSKYEFWHRLKKDKSGKYLYRVYADNNKDITDVIYHDIFGKPIVVKENRSTTWYKYNSLGLVLERKTPIERFAFEYDNQCKKVSSILREEFRDYKKVDKVTLREKSKFAYSKPKCNLNFAVNSNGTKVKVGYDRFGRINKLIDQSQKFVTLTYDPTFGKPSLITRPGLGVIKITYDREGQMKDVKSKQGDAVAAQVASVFNNLLEVVAPVTEGLSI